MLTSQVFDICKKEDVVFLQIPAFSETGLVKHCFSTRHGGVSEGIFEHMNLGFNRGDADENVRRNFEILCDAMEVSPENMVFTDQVHADLLAVVGKEDIGKGFNRASDIIGIDGLMTQEKEVVLVTFYADCVPLYFLDPVQKVIALSHAGWRGTVKKIGAQTIQKMESTYGCLPENIRVAIGPSIGPCCFEVSLDVILEVEKTFPHDIMDKLVKSKGNGKYLVDLATANEIILRDAGITTEHITKTDLCTMCHKDDLFSHRGSQGKRGSMVAMMALK